MSWSFYQNGKKSLVADKVQKELDKGNAHNMDAAEFGIKTKALEAVRDLVADTTDDAFLIVETSGSKMHSHAAGDQPEKKGHSLVVKVTTYNE